MRIAVNAVPMLQDTPADTGNVITEMLYRLCRLHPDVEFLLITDCPWQPTVILPPNAQHILLKPWTGGRLGQYAWRRWQWRKAIRKYKADRVLCIDEVLPVPVDIPAYLMLTRQTEVLDRASTSKYIRQYTGILLFSVFMREQVNKRFGGLDAKIHELQPGVSETYIPLNWEEREEVKREYADGMEYYISVASIHPDNNIRPLLKAFSMLKKRLRTSMKLVLAGRLTHAGEEIAESLQTYKFRDDVIWVENPEETELARLIAGAYGLVHTAGADGLAVPIYMALRCQVPAVALYAGASPEAGGDAALNAVPDDITDLSEKLGALYKDEMLRSKLLAHITRAESWDEGALQLGRIITT
ncbi:glycosyltransferase [Chitinophaga niabensis]|uniref:Glycosyltransferase involved in cell wall bisynthesis n=1 Tax=Chitinophaga niabensis TaxID=536979 RepID=A0A1N6JWU3_9BACT|nr:glycosyltransferase [Chitinophaga niabensis]SIO48701.1 Glycosyltransferase involved in cell wall bisynthesis [Chitinophaga niabensis]